MPTPHQILQKYWGYTSFRGQQEEIIHAVLQKQNVFALLPTGGGKSMCYQIPTLCMNGLCIVISPLIALMKDQVEQLQKRGIRAAALHSGLAKEELINILQKAEEKHYSFLYVSPERLQHGIIKEYLPHLPIVLLAVDEAHCISQWGYDFRPPYLQIHQAWLLMPKVPCIAVTATATEKVQTDILQHLQIPTATIVKQSFDKPNVSFSVFEEESKIHKLYEILKKVKGSSIVYCRNRKQTQHVAELLTLEGFSADFYHAGLTTKERNKKQQLWMQNTLQTIVCTNAFGMGIDKPNVRVVVHFDVPDCIENYYQEAGRAGRDMQKSYAVLLYNQQDAYQLLNLPNLRFPPIETIKHVYQCLADFLQIPVGIGKDNVYPFSLADFVANFNLHPLTTTAALKIIEQQGHIIINDAVFRTSTVQFTTTRLALEDIESMYPNLDIVVKFLLRTYQAILENEVAINENTISKNSNLTIEQVIDYLQQLHRMQLIVYKPFTDKPFIQFLLNRAPANFLHINEALLYQQKDSFTQRVKAMHNYLSDYNTCRSDYLASYFKMPLKKKCGICDNCLHSKAKPINEALFNDIEKEIQTFVLKNNTATLQELYTAINASALHIKLVIDFLVEQQQLVVNNNFYMLPN